MNIEKITEIIKEMLPQKRFNHSKNVAKCAFKLADIYNIDKDMAYLAGIAHDCAKYLTNEEVNYYVYKYEIKLNSIELNNIALSHSIIGSYIAKHELNIDNEDILNAIKYHTTGRENMTILEKVIYMADLIEEDRVFPNVDLLRELTYKGDIDKALLLSFDNTIKFVIDNNQIIHPRTIDSRNYLLNKNINNK